MDVSQSETSKINLEKPDWLKIREQFPILSQKVHGKDLIYFDNAASSQKPKEVIQALESYYTTSHANVHRGIHELSNRATSIYENARKSVADYLGASSEREIIFTRGTTESLNLLAYSWSFDNLKEGDRICLSEMEHHSNMVPWQMLSKMIGFQIDYIPVTGTDGHLDMDAYLEILKQGCKLVSITHVSNTLGTINPIKEICRLAAEYDTISIVDGAQSGGHMPVNVGELGCDFYAMSGHKACGPTGIGVLFGKGIHLEKLRPFQGGGEMITQVTLDGPTFNVHPHKFEAGTPNICGAAGLNAALDFISSIGRQNIEVYDHSLVTYAYQLFSQLPGIQILGPSIDENRGAVLSFHFKDIHSHDLVTLADTKGLALRSGHHCNQPLMNRLGLSSTARASFYFYNTRDEIDSAFQILNRTCEMLA